VGAVYEIAVVLADAATLACIPEIYLYALVAFDARHQHAEGYYR
jgi:hypothetical protein